MLICTHVPAAPVPCARSYSASTWESRTVFCRMCSQKGKSKLTKYPISSTCHFSELLHQTTTWFPYFVIVIVIPQESQVSIGNSAVESRFCQRSDSRPLRQEGSTVGPVGRSRWIESQPALQNYLNLNVPLLWLCKGYIK